MGYHLSFQCMEVGIRQLLSFQFMFSLFSFNPKVYGAWNTSTRLIDSQVKGFPKKTPVSQNWKIFLLSDEIWKVK